MSLAQDIDAMIRRCHGDVSDLTRKMRTLPPGERAIVRVHANVKEALANELRRLLDRHSAHG